MINLFTFGLRIELIEDLGLELIKTSPAWIALIISLGLPFLTKKLEIEKSQKMFIFQEQYKAYCEHFDKLCLYNIALRELLVEIKLNTDEKIDNINEIRKASEKLFLSWEEINRVESRLWLIAPNTILEKKNELIDKVRNFNSKLDISDSKITKENLAEMQKLAQDIQTPLSEYLKEYREQLRIKKLK